MHQKHSYIWTLDISNFTQVESPPPSIWRVIPSDLPCCQSWGSQTLKVLSAQGAAAARCKGDQPSPFKALTLRSQRQDFFPSFPPRVFPSFFEKITKAREFVMFDHLNLGGQKTSWVKKLAKGFFPRFSKSSKLRKHPGDFRVYFPLRKRTHPAKKELYKIIFQQQATFKRVARYIMKFQSTLIFDVLGGYVILPRSNRVVGRRQQASWTRAARDLQKGLGFESWKSRFFLVEPYC